MVKSFLIFESMWGASESFVCIAVSVSGLSHHFSSYASLTYTFLTTQQRAFFLKNFKAEKTCLLKRTIKGNAHLPWEVERGENLVVETAQVIGCPGDCVDDCE